MDYPDPMQSESRLRHEQKWLSALVDYLQEILNGESVAILFLLGFSFDAIDQKV